MYINLYNFYKYNYYIINIINFYKYKFIIINKFNDKTKCYKFFLKRMKKKKKKTMKYLIK